jgi:hypothetical protein
VGLADETNAADHHRTAQQAGTIPPIFDVEAGQGRCIENRPSVWPSTGWGVGLPQAQVAIQGRGSAQADLVKDSFSGEQFCGKPNHEAQHGQPAIPGFREYHEAEAGGGVSHGESNQPFNGNELFRSLDGGVGADLRLLGPWCLKGLLAGARGNGVSELRPGNPWLFHC